jgi:hypothetical protein
MVSDPSRQIIIITIVGGREEIIGQQIILMVERNIINSPAQRHEASIVVSESFRNRFRTSELVVGDGIDTWRRSKRIDKERSAAASRCARTNCAVVEVQRTIENVGLPSVVALSTKYPIRRRLVIVRKSGSGSDRIGVEKPSVRGPVKCGYYFSSIIDAEQVRDDPRTDASVRIVNRCQLRSVGIIKRTSKNAWKDRPEANRHPFPVLADWSYFLGKRTRGAAHDQCRGYEDTPSDRSGPNS